MPVSKIRIAKWFVEVIKLAYEALNIPPPSRVKAHSTRAQATSWAALMRVEPSKICEAATWSSTCTFATHCSLNLFHQAQATFGVAVLKGAFCASDLSKSGSLKGFVIPRTKKS